VSYIINPAIQQPKTLNWPKGRTNYAYRMYLVHANINLNPPNHRWASLWDYYVNAPDKENVHYEG